jgi:hypothetical protein
VQLVNHPAAPKRGCTAIEFRVLAVDGRDVARGV